MLKTVTFAPEMIPEAARLEKACFSDAWSENGLKGSLEDRCGYMLAAEENGKVLGYLAARIVLDEGELLRICVEKKSRGRGIGRRLLETMLKDNAAASLWRLDVRCGNAPAIRLYESEGFKVTVRNKNFYADPAEDGFLMTRTLC